MKNFDLKRPGRGKYYTYFNANPKKTETGDCVIRAISIFLDQTWYQTFDELVARGRDLALMPNSQRNYEAYLEAHHAKHVQTMFKGQRKHITGKAFAKAHKEGRYLLRMANHLSVCVDGILYDIWDVSDSCVYKAWER